MNQESSNQKLPAGKQPQASKTSSTPKKSAAAEKAPPTVEEILASIRDKQAEAIELFGELYGLLGDDQVIPPDVRPGPDDMVLLYDIRLVDKKGELIRLKGRNDFPEALHPSLISQTLQKFQRAFVEQIGEPLAARLMRHLGDKAVLNQEPLPSLPPAPVASAAMVDDEDEDSPDNGFLSKDLP